MTSTIDERWQSVRRVLVVRLDNLGDVLVTTPAIHAVRQALPEAQITLLASPVGAQAGSYTVNITATGDRSVAAHTIHGGVRTGDTRP